MQLFCSFLVYSQTLLAFGANPDLRDEDGKTPLDKARERGDEGHREVITILQSPGEGSGPVNSLRAHGQILVFDFNPLLPSSFCCWSVPSLYNFWGHPV